MIYKKITEVGKKFNGHKFVEFFIQNSAEI